MKLGVETLEQKFLEKYGSMTESEYWWFVEAALQELLERDGEN